MYIKIGCRADGKPYKWRDWQKPCVKKFREKKNTVIVVARQHGKTELGIKMLEDFCFRYKRRLNPTALVCMKTAEQAFKYYFSRLDKFLRDLPGDVYKRVGSKDTNITIYFNRPHFGDTVTINFTGIGNASALKGGTYDFMVLDEMAFYPPRLWLEVFKPMTDDTDGKVLMTSTMMGRNHFYHLKELYRKKDAEGDPRYGHIDYTVHNAGERTKEWIEDEKEGYIASGDLHLWKQEYENDPDAFEPAEAPFAVKVATLADEGRYFDKEDEVVFKTGDYINVNVDIGTAGNMATWCWKRSPADGKILVYSYEDKYDGLKDLINNIFADWRDRVNIVNVIFPDDLNHPSLTDGLTRHDQLLRHIHQRGYGRRLNIMSLPKIKTKNVLWNKGSEYWADMKFNYDLCQSGLNKLSGIRFKKNTTDGAVEYGKTVRNGCEHAGDAYLYIVAAVDDGFVMKQERSLPDIFDDFRDNAKVNYNTYRGKSYKNLKGSAY